jgi:ATP-binding cassette subfamily B (MDR/TAP) protein 1
VGFVGSSGCGKSTIHQLLQRFYDPAAGQILLDGVDIRDYDVHHLRSSLGVVSQEPVLFNDTIGSNIKYNRHGATHDDVVRAANEANFNPEVEKLELVGEPTKEELQEREKGHGFDKNVGVKGSHISGGQKQRVAIARVIIRKPNVLLLDEATSALDSANERKVQESLDRIMEGKTCINIAHRIDTIKNSNVIMVFEKGVIAEKGTYEELVALKGHFYKLEKGL